MKKLISRKEAAELLQVHPQTISNYAERGLLSEVRKGSHKLCYYYEDQVRSIIGASSEIQMDEQDIQRYKDEIAETKRQYKALKDGWRKRLLSGLQAASICDVIISLCKMGIDDAAITVREKEIVKGYLDMKTTEEIGEDLGLSCQRIRQIFFKATRRLYLLKDSIERSKVLEAENEALRKKVAELNTSIEVLKAIKEKSGVSPEEIDARLHAEDLLLSKHPILKEHLRDMNLRVRTYNGLRAAHIDTMYDLVKLRRIDVIRFRNLGRKSIYELDLLLEKHGLHYGMVSHE